MLSGKCAYVQRTYLKGGKHVQGFEADNQRSGFRIACLYDRIAQTPFLHASPFVSSYSSTVGYSRTDEIAGITHEVCANETDAAAPLCTT